MALTVKRNARLEGKSPLLPRKESGECRHVANFRPTTPTLLLLKATMHVIYGGALALLLYYAVRSEAPPKVQRIYSGKETLSRSCV